MPSELVELRGHIIDSLILAKVLDLILEAGGDYRLVDVDIGRTTSDTSFARIEVSVGDHDGLANLLETLHIHGANRVDVGEAEVVEADRDGVLPEGFYSTTNLPTRVRLGGAWLEVANPEMDCALVIRKDEAGTTARTLPMHAVRRGDLVVVGHDGVKVDTPERPRGPAAFEFMNSEVSSEKPKALVVQEVAGRLREARDAGAKILAVCGPAVIHTGAGPDVAALVAGGWINVLFAGNGFATHDIESNILGTSLGVSLHEGKTTEGGHANHLRVINEIRRHGSIAAAVEAGFLTGGVMYECVRAKVPFVLGGSVRDDGPLPDVFSDTVRAVDAMRALVTDVSVALMLASTLHAIATGNILPSSVETYCVDINQAVVTKLADRGSHQALGIVTDVGLFLRQLRAELAP
jgi:lysine-ketoglutarate reductase/saccharopine dehydrogenase-like protein (TIGR00300 family)